MGVYLTADLHLGHRLVPDLRDFPSVEDHDDAVIAGMQSVLGKRDKLFILGDVAFSREALRRVDEIPGLKVLVLGNHDKFRARVYLDHFHDVLGATKERGFLLTHVPIHPQELLRFRANLHGHVHENGKTRNPPGFPECSWSVLGSVDCTNDSLCSGCEELLSLSRSGRYLNVGVEYHDYKPIRFQEIMEMFPEMETG